MTLARVTTWSVGQVLTSAALNAEFDNIINNPLTLLGSMTGTTGDLLRATSTNTWARLSIGSTNDFLQVVGGVPAWVEAPTATLGVLGTTSTDGFALESTTGTNAQWSPRLRWRGYYSGTTIIDWWAEVQPQAAATGAWVLSSRDSLGATVARLTVDITNTRLNIPSGWTYAINGTQISAANLSNGTTGTAGTAVVLATSPTLVSPTLGVAAATSLAATGNIQAPTFTATAATGTGMMTYNITDNTSFIHHDFQESSVTKAGVQYIGSSHALGATRQGFLEIRNETSTGGVTVWTNATRRADFDQTGSFKLAGTAVRSGTAGTNRVDIFDGTAPTGTLANGISLYSTSGELRVMDAGGTATLLSPHDDDNFWVFDSVDTRTGEHLRIDVEKLLRFVNGHFGLDFVKGYMARS